jgi:hypothetical protein
MSNSLTLTPPCYSDAQVKQLRDAGPEKVFRETASGARSDRAQFSINLIPDSEHLPAYRPQHYAGPRLQFVSARSMGRQLVWMGASSAGQTRIPYKIFAVDDG